MDREAHIREWIRKVSILRPELGGFAVCPYASNAKYKIVECNIDDIEPIEGYDVVIFIVEDYHSVEDILDWVESYNKIHEDWEFYEDCAEKITFVGEIQSNNGLYNLILAQPKAKLRKLREILGNTKYYDYWDDDYMRKLLGDDYDLVKKQG
jgi:hypothetical protein